jgi:chromosome segregation protein
MRIKQLELTGFKSFVSRTVLEFPEGVTGIVGPNGCGKSNVVDAIRWVLGEQSSKHLRGDSMEDVIFKGNERVAPLGMAQVSLTMENDGSGLPADELEAEMSSLPAHLRNLSEITISRRYFRSGESDYFINKTPCRLKDITELFLGTGVGTKAYAIIEQGRVEQLINAKPEDRRLFIEEAAGTTLYRSRKVSAERKMERTRENLARVNDVLREIERQVQYLHRMAKKAEQYRALQQEVRVLEIGVSAMQWRSLAWELAGIEEELTRTREARKRVSEALRELEEERAVIVAEQDEAEEALATQREAAAVLDAERRSLQQRIAFLGQEKEERERRAERLGEELARLGGQRQGLLVEHERQAGEASADADRLAAEEAALVAAEADLVRARAAAQHAAGAVEEGKSALLATVSEEAECRNGLALHGGRLREAQRIDQKLRADQRDAAEHLAALEHAVAARGAELQQLRQRLQNTEGARDEYDESIRRVIAQRQEQERETDQARDVVMHLRSRLESLREIHRDYEGYEPGVRSMLLDAEDSNGVLGVVADVLGVPEEHERAVAAALGDRLQYVIVRAEDDGVGAVHTLRDRASGRGSFIPLKPRQIPLNGNGASTLNGNTRRLLDLVEVEDRFRNVVDTLLADVVLVPDLQTGLGLWRQNGVHVTMVTPDGDVIDANGVVSGGSDRPVQEEIVARGRLLAELALTVTSAEGRLAGAEEGAQRLAADLQEQERAREGLGQDAHELALSIVAVQKERERLQAECPHWLDRHEVARFDAATALSDREQAAAEIERLQQELDTLEGRRATLETELQRRNAGAQEAAAKVDELGATVTGIKVRIAELRQRREATTRALARLDEQLHDVDERQVRIRSEREAARAEQRELVSTLATAASDESAQEERAAEVEAGLRVARQALDAAGERVDAHEAQCRKLREESEELLGQGNQHEVSLAERRLRAEHLVQNIREKYECDLTAEEPTAEVTEDPQASSRLEELRAKLARIGEVNVGAIEELRELEERVRFLKSQKEDLERSLADLERTIQRLNRASRARFAETFAAVNEKFQEVLPRLFRGGEARLVLTDENNVLESGVDIVVRPPGKRLDTVKLLSGGEKALVAVSLIFSLFLINPTPFCFLDEVDAPLDDANISRFAGLVREMSERSQFIVITHNKRTMQAADVLYGVTMEEPGISKVISVAMH